MNALSRMSIADQHISLLSFGPNPSFVWEALNSCNVPVVIDYIDDLNPSVDAPYHGAFHEAAMVTLVFEASKFFNLRADVTRNLVLAAAFHDYDHTGGNSTDDVNISRAVAGVSAALKNIVGTEDLDDVTASVIELIKCTQYPYVAEPIGLLQGIMRDADLMMPYLPIDDAVWLFRGLKREMEISRGPILMSDFADGVLDFYSKVKWHTSWAQRKAEKHNFETRLLQLNRFLKMTEA